MATHTIDRTNVNLTDDSGSGTDGTIFNAAWATAFMDAIDGIFSGGIEGVVFLNDTANANMTNGITINQAGADDEILTFKSSDIAHGYTTRTETDTYLKMAKHTAGTGGLELTIMAEDAAQSTVFECRAVGGTPSTTKTTGGRALTEMFFEEHDGANAAANITADGNLFGVRARIGGSNLMRFMVDEDGDVYSVLAAQTFDDHDDLGLVEAVDRAAAPDAMLADWGDFTRYNEDALVAAGIFGAPVADGGMLNMSQLQRLHNGALRQVGRELTTIKRELAEARATLQQLTA